MIPEPLQEEIARLTREDRAELRAYLDCMDVISDHVPKQDSMVTRDREVVFNSTEIGEAGMRR